MANKLPKESDFPALLGTNGSGKPRPIFPSPWIPGSHHDRKPGSKKNNYDRLLSMNPYQQALDLSDVDSCVVLENECFPPSEAASREKVSHIALEDERERERERERESQV
jgi:hypothetical protein